MKQYLLVLILISFSSLLVVQAENYEYSLEGMQPKSLEMKELCQYTDSKKSKITCEIDQGSYLPLTHQVDSKKSPWDELVVVEYNIDRNGRGGDGPNEEGLDPIVEVLLNLGHIDVIIMSEVARDCPQWESVNGAQYIAEKLKMEWTYAVEFWELNDQIEQNGYQCTIGNAILSNRPLSNINQKVFKSQCCQFGGRAGGRVAIEATIPSFGITLISSHLESGTGVSDFLQAMIVRDKQSVEMTNMIDREELKDNIVLVGGDFNSPLRQFSKGDAFKDYLDPFNVRYPWPTRNTCVGDVMNYFGLGAFDYMYLSNHESFAINAKICRAEFCSGRSDHYPLELSILYKKE